LKTSIAPRIVTPTGGRGLSTGRFSLKTSTRFAPDVVVKLSLGEKVTICQYMSSPSRPSDIAILPVLPLSQIEFAVVVLYCRQGLVGSEIEFFNTPAIDDPLSFGGVHRKPHLELQWECWRDFRILCIRKEFQRGELCLSVIFGREASFILAPAEFGIVGVTSSKHVWDLTFRLLSIASGIETVDLFA
jgi:hypothetical protein